jgi:predicted NAD-dependent protein-ADP-ribosyltransferase YbiA (DUF1768 family)
MSLSSTINSDVIYKESTHIFKDDIDYESELYEMNMKNVNVQIALGNVKNTFIEKDIYYFPIYLLNKNNKVNLIGVFEMKSFTYLSLLNDKDEFELEKCTENPLLFSFVTPNFLKLNSQNSQNSQNRENQKVNRKIIHKNEIMSKEREDIFTITKSSQPIEFLNEESGHIKTSYTNLPSHTWIQTYMKNEEYSIVDNEGGGDCFFSTIRDAFSSIGQHTTVQHLRTKLSEQVNDALFKEYKFIYDSLQKEFIDVSLRLKVQKVEFDKLKNEYKDIVDKTQKKEYKKKIDAIRSDYDINLNQKKQSGQLVDEYKFMKNINTIDKMKKVITTCEFWAETWAISTMERILNVKFIILSSEFYHNNDLQNVLQCGQLNDNVLQKKGEFHPDFYILIEYTGFHYKLIGYKNTFIFTFSEIPFDLKKIIVQKCLQTNAGTFSLIPEFKEFKHSFQGGSSRPNKIIPFSNSTTESLFDDSIHFMISSNSFEKPFPGKGAGEKIPFSQMKLYYQLSSIPQWRNKLSDLWIQPFQCDDVVWASVEHYTQANKYKEYPEIYQSFSIQSNSPISNTILNKKKIHIPSHIVPKPINEMDIRELAQKQKFQSHPDLHTCLLETKHAKLLCPLKNQPPIELVSLMRIRNQQKK